MIITLFTIVGIAGVVGISFRSMVAGDLARLLESHNESLAQGYITSVWGRYRPMLLQLAQDPAQAKNLPQVGEYAKETQTFFQDVLGIRANIYNANGQLLMSTNTRPNERFAGGAASPAGALIGTQMKSGIIASRILSEVPTQRGVQSTFIQSVIPVKSPVRDAPSEGAVEILYDITEPWGQMVRFQLVSIGGIVAILLMFLGVLFLTSRKAESIIARQHEANLELAEAAAAAQAENRDKSQFLANVSHELRTPLNAIIGFSEIIKNEAQAEGGKNVDYISDIHSSGVHLLSLINDILDYSKAEAGKLELEVSEVSANKTILNCMRLVGPRAETAQVSLVENLPKEQMILVTDGKKFKQVLLNLLSNAVKFTPAGGQVSVSGWQNIQDDSFSFEVRDSGIGIAPKDISRAMAPFGQVDNTLKRKYEGTGLGLPLTKKFVELMGGKFTIESEVNVGTKITFTLPRAITERDGVIIKQLS